MPLPTQQALEPATLFLYFSAMSGVLAQKACWPLVHTTAILVTALSLNQLRELPAICVSLVRLSRLKWKKRSSSCVFHYISRKKLCSKFQTFFVSLLPHFWWSLTGCSLETCNQNRKGLREVELYYSTINTTKQKINRLRFEYVVSIIDTLYAAVFNRNWSILCSIYVTCCNML